MDKEGFNKFIGILFLLALLTFAKQWFNYSYIFVWLGVLIGFYLPFIDHLFYAFFLRPDTEVSRNIRNYFKKQKFFSVKNIRELVTYVNNTKNQREKLIIHTAYFQVVFCLLTFYILTSSSGLFGRGLVYGFTLKLLVEEFFQYFKYKNIEKWFSDMNINMDGHKTRAYLYAVSFVLFVFTLML